MSRASKHNDLDLSLEEDSPVPLYLRVKQMISQKIYEGTWTVNKKIPSESELVNLLGCSRMTVNRALRELTSEGLLVRIQGVGSFDEGRGKAVLSAWQRLCPKFLVVRCGGGVNASDGSGGGSVPVGIKKLRR